MESREIKVWYVFFSASICVSTYTHIYHTRIYTLHISQIVWIHQRIYMCKRICVDMCMHTYAFVYTCAYSCMNMCMHKCVYGYIYGCTYTIPITIFTQDTIPRWRRFRLLRLRCLTKTTHENLFCCTIHGRNFQLKTEKE